MEELIAESCELAEAWIDDARAHGRKEIAIEMAADSPSRMTRAIARELRRRGHSARAVAPPAPHVDYRSRPRATPPRRDNPGCIEVKIN